MISQSQICDLRLLNSVVCVVEIKTGLITEQLLTICLPESHTRSHSHTHTHAHTASSLTQSLGHIRQIPFPYSELVMTDVGQLISDGDNKQSFESNLKPKVLSSLVWTQLSAPLLKANFATTALHSR